MTTGSEKSKAVEEIVSAELETSKVENNRTVNLVAGPRKSPRVHPEILDEIKTSPRKEIMSGLSKILAEYQRKLLKLKAPSVNNQSNLQNLGDSDSETKNIFSSPTSTPIKTKATASNNTP